MKKLIAIVILCCSVQTWAMEADSVCHEMNYRDSITNYAANYIGVPYKWGGVTPDGFDCSGFVLYVFERFGVQLPHSSRSMADLGEKRAKTEAKAGDVIFFKGRNTTTIGHAGIVYHTSEDEVFFIHSSSPRGGGVKISSLSNSYYKQRFVKIVDVITQNLV